MEKIFAKAQAQLISRASILLQIGAANHLRTNAWPNIESFVFELDDILIEFDGREGKPYDENVINETLEELDAKIFQAKKDAQFTISLIEAWGA